MIKDYIGTPALLEQFAEECAELAQASLKYARKLRGENPTPKNVGEILDNFHEEIADVLVCIDELTKSKLIDYEYVVRIKQEKRKRWRERVNSKDEFIDIYDHYEEWCLILACVIVTRKRISCGKVKRIIDDIFGEERLKWKK